MSEMCQDDEEMNAQVARQNFFDGIIRSHLASWNSDLIVEMMDFEFMSSYFFNQYTIFFV